MLKEIYLAGGCFWGTEAYLCQINGVTHTEVGYANGTTTNPTYEQVCSQKTGHAETVKVTYDTQIVGLPFLLTLYYDVIEPSAVNRQGGDSGTQYRTGIYYNEPQDEAAIRASIAGLQERCKKPVAIEILPLQNYSLAEEYHQHYLAKNPGGYCHIGADKMCQAAKAVEDRPVGSKAPSREELQKSLTPLQFDVTQNGATEPPFRNVYHDQHEKGIYVDIITGEPLFSSTDKFESGCGWPAFSRPIQQDLVYTVDDLSHGMQRTEVRSMGADAHLGHLFTDGPAQAGGLRYCVNSASLRFVRVAEMERQGYGSYLKFVMP